MTKAQLKRRLKAAGEPITNRAIADIFGIVEQAVQLWKDDKPIPQLRVYQLREKRPDLFRVRA